MTNTIVCLLVMVMIVSKNEAKGTEKMKKLFEWCPGKIKFIMENPKIVYHLLETGKFIPKNNVPTGLAVAVHPNKKRAFVTLPRWKKGVLSTLNWVPIGTGNLNEPLRPYPCWEANDIYTNSKFPYKIISVIRVFVDLCDRLWVIDNGYDEKITNRTQIEPPKLLIFDINKNVLIRIYKFDSTTVKFTKSSLGKILVDVTQKTCDKAFAYITDVTAPGLIVYDFLKNKAFRIEHNYFSMEPLKSSFYVNGKKYYANLHVDGICLSGLYKDNYRNLYISAQTSNKQFVTSTKFLQDENNKDSDVIYYLGERCNNCQAGGAQVIDEKTGVMIYSELNKDSISCWNGDLNNFGPHTQEIIIVSNELNYVSDLIITLDRELAAISNQLRKFFYSDEGVTTRVFVGILDDLIEGTKCQYHSTPKFDCCHH